MRHLAVLLILSLAGCEPIVVDVGDEPSRPAPSRPQPQDGQCSPDGRCCPFKTVPPVDLPRELRSSNYGGGSCMHAAFQDVLRWQNQERVAAYWRANYSGGASIATVEAICNRLGLEFAYTTAGDEAFLEWCSKTRRGAAIYWDDADHAITFCGFVGNDAVLIDNNYPSRVQRMPRAAFLAEWRKSTGRAVTAVYSPAPPLPWI